MIWGFIKGSDAQASSLTHACIQQMFTECPVLGEIVLGPHVSVFPAKP